MIEIGTASIVRSSGFRLNSPNGFLGQLLRFQIEPCGFAETSSAQTVASDLPTKRFRTPSRRITIGSLRIASKMVSRTRCAKNVSPSQRLWLSWLRCRPTILSPFNKRSTASLSSPSALEFSRRRSEMTSGQLPSVLLKKAWLEF